MTVLQNNAESGLSTGTAVTTGNSGATAGDAWSAITLLGAGAITFSDTAPKFGALCYRLFAAGSGDRARCYHSFPASDTVSERFYLRLGADPGVAQTLFAFFDTSYGMKASLAINSSGNAILQNDAGSVVHTFGAFPFGTTAAEWVMLDINITKGTTASNGRLQAELRDAAGDLIGTAYLSTSENTGTTQYIRSSFGGSSSSSNTHDLYIDAHRVDNTQAALLGEAATNVAPVASIMGRPDPQPAGTVTVTGGVTDSDGTVSSAAVTIVSGPNSPTVSNSPTGLGTGSASVSASFLASAGRYVVRVSGTDNAGTASNNAEQIIDVYPASGVFDVSPYQELSNPGAYTVTGATTRIAAITDADPGSYAESPSGPANADLWDEWCAFGPGPIEMVFTAYQSPSTPSTTVDVDVFKEDGTTLIYSDSWTPSATAPASDADTVADHTVTLDPAALAAVAAATDRRALRTRFRANQ